MVTWTTNRPCLRPHGRALPFYWRDVAGRVGVSCLRSTRRGILWLTGRRFPVP